MPVSLSFHADPAALASMPKIAVIGRKKRLKDDDVRALVPVDTEVWDNMLGQTEPGDDGRSTAQWTADRKVVVGVLPEHCSRHNTPTRAMSIPRLVGAIGKRGEIGVVVALTDASHAFAAGLAVARAAPEYTLNTNAKDGHFHVVLLGPDGPITDLERIEAGAAGVRMAARLVDMPPNELTTTALVEEARAVAERTGAKFTVVSGEELAEQGFGGLWGVGKASPHPPALAVLDYDPDGAKGHIAWVGKGIVYDTGGLSIKSKVGMAGMKNDMGGSATVLGGFEATVRAGVKARLTAVLCIAENSVGPDATRPDDVLRMYSGKTVEVNNTDAEGRLVLADGLAWVTKHHEPDMLIDLATLTGAQPMSTGKRHAALYCNNEALERRTVVAGRACGDLVHALPYVPEFFRKEFTSTVADMKNSVKDRSNAQSSCAGQFLRNHIPKHRKPWMHVDMAGPVVVGGKGTGWGVGLLMTLAGVGA